MTFKRALIALGLIILGLAIWLVMVDSNVVRSCEHRGGENCEVGK